MTILTCAAVQRRLQAFHDRELPVGETIAVEHHVSTCPPCARDLREVQALGDVLRSAAAPSPSDDWAGVQAGVISRMRAEATQSWPARARRFVDDLHLVWIGFASAAATIVCAGTVLSMLQVAPQPVRADSLASIMAVADAGADLSPTALEGRNPLFGGPMRVQAPSVPHDGVVFATLENALPNEEDRLLPLSASVTSEGHVSELRSLSGQVVDDDAVLALIRGLSRGRLEPAQYGGDPVAVNYIWVVAHTTVRGKT